jgi:DNA topoisomerase-1
VLAAKALADVATFASHAEAKRNVVQAIESVAKRLGNTKAVCRKCYIHPAILDAYMEGATIATLKPRTARLAASRAALAADEAAVVMILERRLRKTA